MVEFYKIKGQLASRSKEVVFGDPNNRRVDLILLGRLAEMGPLRDVWFDISGEQVVAVVGKRGTGKSYTLGSVLEGLCTRDINCSISRASSRRAVLLFDTLDIFWTSKLPLADRDPPRVREQYAQLAKWKLRVEPLSVEVWMPAGFEKPVDPAGLRPFFLDVADLDPYDWATLMGFDLMNEPRGQLLNEAYRKVVKNGWTDGATRHDPKPEYAIADLVDCIRGDSDILADYVPETRRAVVQRLQSYASYRLMSGKGTPLTDLLKPGTLSVFMTARLNPDLRSVLAAVLIRKLMESRSLASFTKKRLETDHTLSDHDRQVLERSLTSEVPRTWIAIDEAQNVVPSEYKTSAQEAVIKLVKEGRNIGLSLAFTTQQPGSIDQRVMSQVTTFIVHQLATERDFQGVESNLKSTIPDEIVAGKSKIDFRTLMRSLELGQAVVSATPLPDVDRCFIVNVRPRVAVHGGFED